MWHNLNSNKDFLAHWCSTCWVHSMNIWYANKSRSHSVIWMYSTLQEKIKQVVFFVYKTFVSLILSSLFEVWVWVCIYKLCDSMGKTYKERPTCLDLFIHNMLQSFLNVKFPQENCTKIVSWYSDHTKLHTAPLRDLEKEKKRERIGLTVLFRLKWDQGDDW